MIFAQVLIKIIAIFILKLCFIKAAIYELLLDNDDIFEPCSHLPNNNGIYDIFDLSDFVMDYRDGKIYCHGNITLVWDIKPTDRVQLSVEVYKYQRGAWQQTPVSMRVADFCKEFFKSDTIWYKCWTHAIQETDVCINNKGHILHHDYFFVDTTLEMPQYIEGRIKLAIYIEGFNKNNIKNPSNICIEITGDIIKHRTSYQSPVQRKTF